MNLDPQQVKIESEQIILRAGGQVCEWLPSIERKCIRPSVEIIGRALVLNALLNIYFNAPISVVRGWLEKNQLSHHLTQREKDLLSKKNEQLHEQELQEIFWNIESLWAFMWVGSRIEEMPFDSPVENYMASLAPNLQKNEDSSMFSKEMRVRAVEEIFRMLDLYYRLHWYALDGQLNGYATDPIKLNIVANRRKALEWALSDQSWDHIELNT